MTTALPVLERPRFCQYAEGPCDQDFEEIEPKHGLFLFGSEPGPIAGTIEEAVRQLTNETGKEWRTWKTLDVQGRVIFCEICKAVRGAQTVFADVTTLNFNLMFELGFCVGLNVPVKPIRDPSYMRDDRLFKSLGVLETFGYIDFQNASELADKAGRKAAEPPLPLPPAKTYRDRPLYVIRGPGNPEGLVQLFSRIKKVPLRYREVDPDEVPTRGLHHHWKQVRGSYGVFAHLLSPNRGDAAIVHNALSAFLCGIAVADQKAVVMIQEERVPQPIDYRELVRSYTDPVQVGGLLTEPIARVFERLQDEVYGSGPPPQGLLAQIDIGDPAAENEIGGLREYFVQTGQFTAAKQGHARLVVGRKGSGKSAMYYAVRQAIQRGHETVILDMKPEGHQFTRLREAVLQELSPGQRDHTVTAFWTYLLLAEIAHKILSSRRELNRAERAGGEPYRRYKALEEAYFAHGLASGDDLPQRLLRLVDRITKRFADAGEITARTDLTQLIHEGDISTLSDAVAAYVEGDKQQVWLLIDNLDKSWGTRNSTPEDIAILIGLLDASRRLERLLDRRGVELHCLVFIRTDILEHLHRASADRGKDTSIDLDWDDAEVFREILRRRLVTTPGLDGDFISVWGRIAEPTIEGQDSFQYVVDRTLMRPRDMLLFVQDALEVATNRGKDRIEAVDILHAEARYSEEALLALVYEIEDTDPTLGSAIYEFHGHPRTLAEDAALSVLRSAGIPDGRIDHALEVLVWFGFLGIKRNGADEEEFAYQTRFNVRKLRHPVTQGDASLVIHPAFRSALGVRG